ncbi:MAG: enoyl-CoA hydratase/isomerase family protein [Natronospirillum sp.]
MTENVVLFQEIPLSNGYLMGRATLNHEKSLNALSRDMIELLLPQLQAWEDNPQVVMVWLDGAGDRAFCAGGNVVQVYHDMVAARADADSDTLPDVRLAQEYFSLEYELDLYLHNFPKPLLCWASGVVMGGGMGLMQGAHFRVVTETSRLAMPEITIGLYPDVGASWFLNRLPGKTGLFLGLTGAQINAADALFCGLADRFLPNSQHDALLETLKAQSWYGEARADEQLLGRLLRDASLQALAQEPNMLAASPVRQHLDRINRLTDQADLATIYASITNLQDDDPWLQKAAATLRHGSPASAVLIYEQLRRAKHWSLAETFEQELIVSTNCCRYGEFQEGVRALLIEKDRQPKWRFERVEDVDPSYISGHFVAPW